MPRNLLFGMLAAMILGAAIQTVTTAPAQAQASCMHCNFAFAKCKRFGSAGPVTCKQKQTACIKECKAMDTSASGGSDKAKSTGKSEAKSKK